MSSFVLDCSIAICWCIEDEATPQTDALLERLRDEGAIVPPLWYFELGNVLLQAERRGRLNAAQVSARLGLIAELPISSDEGRAARALHETLLLARGEKLTLYDAAYLELAMRRALPIATKDSALRAAALRVGVDVLPP
ncbi:type II toxin-antitoxin system VapC family toxin [Gloeobacter violaceus]|uniref:Gll1679 protein n=1 Tax=Gloeobacter violaceus (strain ATCC 29082 / PCC 7421) TaxID=251221 RepID=Q7NK02_GLOVI|nr:type II toxin-antitoxin system VapC family toxin [Gloeobacter violaceus]BAC89620.1 gll1679 [Gloeobacter violaceus PCC 7421]